MMSFFYSAFLGIHIFSGTIALVLFWISTASKKGSKFHKSSGNWYFIFMWTVIGSAIILCIINLIKCNLENAIYLSFLSLLTSDPLWYSRAILKEKNVLSKAFIIKKKLFGLSLFIFGLSLLIFAFLSNYKNDLLLFVIFGAIGFTGIIDVLKKLPNNIDNHFKLKLHIRGTILSGMAGHTAFIVFGAQGIIQRSINNEFIIFPWLAPVIIALALIGYFNKKYMNRR